MKTAKQILTEGSDVKVKLSDLESFITKIKNMTAMQLEKLYTDSGYLDYEDGDSKMKTNPRLSEIRLSDSRITVTFIADVLDTVNGELLKNTPLFVIFDGQKIKADY